MHTNKAGWADIDITPPLGLPLGGRGPRFTNGATILDPLTIHALALEDATGARTLWLSFDLIGVSFATSAQWRYDLAAATGVPYAAIILNFAHTHSAPMVNFDKYPAVIAEPPALRTYRATLHRKLLDVACAALRTLRPATVTLHSGRSDVGINRRNRNAAGDVVMAPNPDGVYNPDLWVLDVYATTDGSRTSRPPSPADRCIIFNYGCHPVIAYGFAWDGISADYPGVCRRQLKARFGPDVHCQFIQGLAGNVRPRVLAGEDAFLEPKPALTLVDPVVVLLRNGRKKRKARLRTRLRPPEERRTDYADTVETFSEEEAVREALRKHGPDAGIAVMPDGPYVLACLAGDPVGRMTVDEMLEANHRE